MTGSCRDKAIDLMDEAASRVQMEEEEPSEELMGLEEKLNTVERCVENARPLPHKILRRPPNCGIRKKTIRNSWRPSGISAARAIRNTGT